MKAETNRNDVYRKALCLLIPAAGLAFLLWYIKNATCDVVYSRLYPPGKQLPAGCL